MILRGTVLVIAFSSALVSSGCSHEIRDASPAVRAERNRLEAKAQLNTSLGMYANSVATWTPSWPVERSQRETLFRIREARHSAELQLAETAARSTDLSGIDAVLNGVVNSRSSINALTEPAVQKSEARYIAEVRAYATATGELDGAIQPLATSLDAALPFIPVVTEP